ncbi:hypothetical protein GGU45_004004 [Niabella hirudinis]
MQTTPSNKPRATASLCEVIQTFVPLCVFSVPWRLCGDSDLLNTSPPFPE